MKKQITSSLASYIASGYHMVSEVNQKPRKYGFKRHRMPSFAVGRRQPEGKLAAFQAPRRADVLRTSQIQKRTGQIQLFTHLSRKEGISTTHGLTL